MSYIPSDLQESEDKAVTARPTGSSKTAEREGKKEKIDNWRVEGEGGGGGG